MTKIQISNQLNQLPKSVTLEKFGQTFFTGQTVFVNTDFQPNLEYGDPYAELADYYTLGLNIGLSLEKHKQITDLELALNGLNKKELTDFSLGLLQAKWKYSATLEQPELWNIEVDLEAKEMAKLLTFSQAMFFGRNFLMLPPQFNPVDFEKMLTKRWKNENLAMQILDQKAMEKAGLKACLEVNRASKAEPRFFEITIDSAKKAKQTVVIVGKCLYDVGGMALKPADGQRDMYIDKGGAATSIILADYLSKYPLEDTKIVILIPAVRNEISAEAYYNGEIIEVGTSDKDLKKDIEIGNTDAEGRLTLADAVAYAQVHFSGSPIITLATLTGASMRSHGSSVGSFFSNSNELLTKMQNCFIQNGEQAEFFPFRKRYTELLKCKTEVTEYSNIASKAEGGHHTGAEFVRLFLKPGAKLIHGDIAGPVVDSKGKATGYAARSLLDFLGGR